MPRPRKAGAPRRSDLAAWEMVFLSGYDFFGDLPEGVNDAYGRPDTKVAQEAWTRLGAEFMEKHQAEQASARHPLPEEPWALQQFGAPRSAREHRRYTY